MFEASRIDRLVWQARAAAAAEDPEAIELAGRGLALMMAHGGGAGVEAATTWLEGFVEARARRHAEAAPKLAAAASAWERLGCGTLAADAWTDAASGGPAVDADLRARARALARARELVRTRGLVRVGARVEALEPAAGGFAPRRPADGP